MHIESILARTHRACSGIVLPALVATLLAACGGGGGGGGSSQPPATSPNTSLIYGTAATGAGIAGTVSIEDATGRVSTLPVAADSGAFSASVDGMTAPFMLKVTSTDGTTVLYSAAAAPGRANITPLTSLALMRIAAARHLHGPADLFAAPASFGAWLDANQLSAASATMLSRLMPAFVAGLPGAPSTPDTPPTFDSFGTAWTIGGPADRLLDAYPVTFSTDSTGIVTALQTDHARGLAVDVARSDTAAAGATQLTITGAGQGSIVGGSAAQFGAQALFVGGAQQPVSASWSLSGAAGASVDGNGKVSTSDVATAATLTVTARWFDGSAAVTSSTTLTVVPAMRPTSLEITGAAAGSSVAAGASLALQATVHWSDGSTSTPAVAWSWSGDAGAVAQLGSDGLLRAGRPAADSTIHVAAAFTQGGVPVSSDLPLTISRFVRRVQSVSLSGLAAGQVLTAGGHADLTLAALWNDGSESTLAPTWSIPAGAGTGHVATAVSPAGRLTTAAYYVPASADAAARAAEPHAVQATYDNGDGSTGTLRVDFSVKPLVNIPTGLEIRGVTAMGERETASFQVLVGYADGSTEVTDATLVSQEPGLLSPTGTAGSFSAAAYASKLDTPLVATLAASRSFSYQDANGQPVTATLSATQAVTINWIYPVLTGMRVDVDHLAAGVATPVTVTGSYVKFGVQSTAPVANASLAVDGSLVDVAGVTLTAARAPTAADASWATLTATAYDPGAGATLTVRHVVAIGLSGAVPRQLLAYPWSPLDTDVQFRAIASDGHIDDYTVARTPPSLLGYESPAARRRLRLLSGVSDFTQSRMDPRVATGAAQETQYVAAVEHGQVVILRHDDLYDRNSLALPAVLASVSDARRVALVARRDDGSGALAAVRLYVLDGAGIVRQYRLPYVAANPLVASDLVLERQLAGTWSQISAGADFIQLLSTAGAAYAEGSDALGQLGDPALASHWTDTLAVQQGFGCAPACSRYAALTGVSQVHAGVDMSFVALADGMHEWGNTERTLLEWGASSVSFGTDVAVQSLAMYAWVQGDGSVHYRNLAFAEDAAGGPGNIAVGSTRTLATATWLPAARQVVDGRRTAAAATWPTSVGEDNLSPTMPIVRTTADALYYLDGRAIVDAQGQPVVLP